MTILDTHVLIWWLDQPDKLSKKAKQEIDNAVIKTELKASSISIWEICLLVKKNRLKLTMDLQSWIDKIEELPFLQFIPVDNKIALKLMSQIPSHRFSRKQNKRGEDDKG